MNFEVDTEELRFFEYKLNNSSTVLSDEIKYWEKQINELKNIWSGTNADMFYAKIDDYLIKLKMMAETTKIFCETINECYSSYEESDNELTTQLREQNSKYDDEAFLSDPRNQDFLIQQGVITNET